MIVDAIQANFVPVPQPAPQPLAMPDKSRVKQPAAKRSVERSLLTKAGGRGQGEAAHRLVAGFLPCRTPWEQDGIVAVDLHFERNNAAHGANGTTARVDCGP